VLRTAGVIGELSCDIILPSLNLLSLTRNGITVSSRSFLLQHHASCPLHAMASQQQKLPSHLCTFMHPCWNTSAQLACITCLSCAA
jgi:hypothetical protein